MILIHGVKLDTKYDPNLQNSSQKPPMSSKYDCDHDVLPILLGKWKSKYYSKWHIYSKMTIFIHDVKLDAKDDQVLQNISLEPWTSSKYDCILG